MPKKKLIINSQQSFDRAVGDLYAMYDEHKFLSVEITPGSERTSKQSQKALAHIWFREYAAYLLKAPAKTLDKEIVEAFKEKAKKCFYADTGEKWIVVEVPDLWGPNEAKLVAKSMSEWSPGEAFQFLSWLQAKAADDGLILESKGEYAQRQQAQNV